MGERVSKHANLFKKKGKIFKSYKEFECFLMKNGYIVFYTLTESSRKYGQESVRHRIQLDETMRIERSNRVTTSKETGE